MKQQIRTFPKKRASKYLILNLWQQTLDLLHFFILRMLNIYKANIHL